MPSTSRPLFSTPRHGSFFTRFTILCLLLGLLMPALASAQREKFSGTTDVVVVEVPVTVTTRGGDPVVGLTKENFEIVDEGKKQEIIDFEVVNLLDVAASAPGELPPPPPPVPIAARRHFLFYFDMSNSNPESLVMAREAAVDVLEGLHKSDLVGVATYTTNTGTQFILGFTSDRRQVEVAIATLGAPGFVDQSSDPLNVTFADISESPELDTGGAGGRAADAFAEVAADQLETMMRMVTAAENQQAQNRLTAMKRNLEEVSTVLGRIDGRKHVVFLSEGIPDSLLVGDESATGTGSTESAGAGAGVLQDTEAFSNVAGNSRAQNDLAGIIESFRRAGCVVHAVDIGRLDAIGDYQSRPSGVSSLTALAKDTGGELFLNFNDLGDAMDQMLESTSVTYLLAFQPKKLKTDGEYHRLKVKLKNVPGRNRISARAGYYAPKPLSEISDQEQQFDAAQRILDGFDSGLFDVDVLAPVVSIPGEKAYVPLLIEIDGTGFLRGSDGGQAQAQIYIYAFDDDGVVEDFTSRELGLDLAKMGDALRRTGLKYWAHVDLPPGNFNVRILVINKGTGDYSLRRIPVKVSEGSGGSLWPAMVSEPIDRWITVREGADRQRDVAFPFMAAGAPFIPAARPVIAKKGATSVHLMGTSLPDGAGVEAEVVDSNGTTAKASFQVTQPFAAGAAQGELKTKGLAPGEYALNLSTTDAAGKTQTSSMPFIVE